MLMTKNYSEDHLLLYIYQELSASESAALAMALEKDSGLRGKLEELKAAIALIPRLEEEPSQTSVDLIMEYARKVEETTPEKV